MISGHPAVLRDIVLPQIARVVVQVVIVITLAQVRPLASLGLSECWADGPGKRTTSELDPLPYGHASGPAVLDPLGDRVIVFGGIIEVPAGLRVSDDLLLLDLRTKSWTVHGPTGGTWPGARMQHAMAIDHARGVLYLFGGNGCLDDLWQLRLGSDAWELLNHGVAAPSGREESGLAVDPESGRPWLFYGNCQGTSPFSTYAAYDPVVSEWTIYRAPFGRPPRRSKHSIVWDSRRQTVLMYGGYASNLAGAPQAAASRSWPPEITHGQTESLYDTVWSFRPQSGEWSQIVSGNSGPGGLTDAGAAYDVLSDLLLVYGGASSDSFGHPVISGDLWAFSLNRPKWFRVFTPPELPERRADAFAVYDPCAGSLIVGGGVDLPPQRLLQDVHSIQIEYTANFAFERSSRGLEHGRGPTKGTLVLPSDLTVGGLSDAELVDCTKGIVLQSAGRISAKGSGAFRVEFGPFGDAEREALARGSLRVVARSPELETSIVAIPAENRRAHSPARVAEGLVDLKRHIWLSSETDGIHVRVEGLSGPKHLSIHEVSGRKVHFEILEEEANASTVWNRSDMRGRAVVSGVYFLRIETSFGSFSEKLLVLR